MKCSTAKRGAAKRGAAKRGGNPPVLMKGSPIETNKLIMELALMKR